MCLAVCVDNGNKEEKDIIMDAYVEHVKLQTELANDDQNERLTVKTFKDLIKDTTDITGRDEFLFEKSSLIDLTKKLEMSIYENYFKRGIDKRDMRVILPYTRIMTAKEFNDCGIEVIFGEIYDEGFEYILHTNSIYCAIQDRDGSALILHEVDGGFECAFHNVYKNMDWAEFTEFLVEGVHYDNYYLLFIDNWVCLDTWKLYDNVSQGFYVSKQEKKIHIYDKDEAIEIFHRGYQNCVNEEIVDLGKIELGVD